MSDPIRWRAPGGDAPAGVRDLLRHANAPTVMDAATRAKHAAMVAKVAAGAAGAAAGAGAAKMTLGAKLLAGLGLATAVAVGTVPAVRARMAQREATTEVARAHGATAARATERAADAPTAAAVETPAEAPSAPVVVAPTVAEPAVAPRTTTAAPTLTAPTAGATARPPTSHPATVPGHSPSGGATPTAGSAAPAPSLAPVAEAAPVATAPVGATGAPEAPRVEPLAQEQALVESAFEARGNPGEALARADRHAREFPDGQMAPDREFVAVQALIDLGRAAEARTRGEALIARFPGSPYVQRTRRLLDALP